MFWLRESTQRITHNEWEAQFKENKIKIMHHRTLFDVNLEGQLMVDVNLKIYFQKYHIRLVGWLFDHKLHGLSMCMMAKKF